MEVYNKYSTYLKDKYGDKVYKIPVHLQVTCPNRDGACGYGGCTFCPEEGTGFEMREATETIQSQLKQNMNYIQKKYKAKYFIAYFQNYSNTYMPLETFCKMLDEIEQEDIVGVALSTRPDCINTQYLEILKAWSDKYHKEVCIELGLQTVNYHSLKKINRGHGLAEYIEAAMQIKQYGFEVCTHIILNLPWDNEVDVIETAKCVSVLNNNYVKLHALYLVKNTPLAKAYVEGEIELITLEAYKERVILFLRYLAPEIVVQRIIGRAPQEYTVFANWNTSWWKIHDDIVKEMTDKRYYQGDLCDYRNGKAVKKWL